MVLHIQVQEIEYVSKIFFSFPTETAGEIFAVEGLMTGTSVPVLTTELGDINLTILR
jgi:hypothetical protein